MTTHICNKNSQFLHTAFTHMHWLIQASLQPGCQWLHPYCYWNFNYCIVISLHSTPNPPSSIVIATKLYSLEPTDASGVILCINRQSLGRGTSKQPPQAQKVLSIIVRLVVYTEVIGVCIIGLVYIEDFQISLFSLSPPCPDGREQHRSTGNPPLPIPHLSRLGLKGHSIEFNPRHLRLTEFEH